MIVSRNKFLKRRRICQKCEFFKRDLCTINKKYPSDFAMFAYEECPKGKWKASYQILKTLATGALKILKYFLTTKNKASKKLIEQRLNICYLCSEYNRGICGEFAKSTGKSCGCILSLKVRIKSERCPQNKW